MSLAIALVITVGAIAQTTSPEHPSNTVTVKDTPTSRALVKAAKESIDAAKANNDLLQQARSMLDQNQKALVDQLKAIQKDLDDKLKNDKKYAPILAQIADMQKKLNESGQAAQAKLSENQAPFQQKIQTDSAVIQGLIPIVREESGLPDTATFDASTQTWTQPKAVESAKK